jgi:hypothetical protein
VADRVRQGRGSVRLRASLEATTAVLLPLSIGLVAPAAHAADFTTITLQATRRNAGEIGRAFLMPDGNGTRVQIEVSGVPPQVASRPIHLYTFIHDGRCDKRGEQPAYALLDCVIAGSPRSSGIAPAAGPFTVSNSAPLTFDRLRAGPYAIVVRTAPADGDVEIFCGNVP